MNKETVKAHFEPLTEKWFKEAGVTPEAKEHLLKSLRSLELGKAPTPSFPLYGKTDVSVVETFLKLIEGKTDIPEWMLDYERSRLSKFGPQGGYADWTVLEPLFVLYAERPTVCNVPVEIVNECKLKYKKLRLSMLSASSAMQYLKLNDKIQERAAGCPDFNLKKTDPIAQEHAIIGATKLWYFRYFGYVFSRFNKQKPRIFMPMPFSSMVAQAQWFAPFLAAIQDDLNLKGAKSEFTFWSDKIGFDKCFKIIATDQYREARSKHPDLKVTIFVQRDFEKMDTTTGSSQLESGIVVDLAEAYNYKEGTKPYNLMKDAMLYTATAPIVSPSGVMVGNHGTASGAEITNGGETCSNEQYSQLTLHILDKLIKKLAEEQNIVIHYCVVSDFGNGDDGFYIILLDDPEHLEKFQELLAAARDEAAHMMGFRTQAMKDLFSTQYGLYCQNMVWIGDKDTVEYAYPAVLILNSIMNPEHEYTPAQWDKDYRDIDIIEKLDNGCNLPYFHDLVDFVDNGMKYHLLGRNEVELKRILSKYERYRALQSLSERYNRSDYDIAKSPTIKYLMSKESIQRHAGPREG